MKRAACMDMASPFGARLLMCSDGVSGCITALAIVRWRLSKFIRHAPERFSQESDSLSMLRCALREKSECCRPIQAMSQCGRLSESRGRTVSRPGQSPDDRGYREYIFRTWSDRQSALPESRARRESFVPFFLQLRTCTAWEASRAYTFHRRFPSTGDRRARVSLSASLTPSGGGDVRGQSCPPNRSTWKHRAERRDIAPGFDRGRSEDGRRRS